MDKVHFAFRILGLALTLYSFTWWYGVYSYISRGTPPQRTTVLQTLTLTITGISLIAGASFWGLLVGILFFFKAFYFGTTLSLRRQYLMFTHTILLSVITAIIAGIMNSYNLMLSGAVGLCAACLIAGLMQGVARWAQPKLITKAYGWLSLLPNRIRPHKDVDKLETLRISNGIDNETFEGIILGSPWATKTIQYCVYKDVKMAMPEASEREVLKELLRSRLKNPESEELFGVQYSDNDIEQLADDYENLEEVIDFFLEEGKLYEPEDETGLKQKIYDMLDEIGVDPKLKE